ncbi:MAG TPA: FGGY family carbohydrate kinase [Gaiellaceae bacterium]|nr:FGGY family carbohydrate kinase [Gaiellaceae bacterium]
MTRQPPLQSQIHALDIGTSSVRAQLFDPRGEAAGELRQEGYETDDPAAVAAAVRRVLAGEEADATSCFAHSLVAVDEDGNALTPILGWRDTRSAAAAEWLARRLDADAVHARTGAFLHPSFWPAKLAWLAETEPETFRRAARFVSFADYLHGARETSLGMASTSGLLDLTTQDWDEELLATLGVDRERVPRIADVPLWADAACSNAGAGCTTRDRAALMVGTSGALRVLYESERPQPKPGLFLYLSDERHVVEGGALSDGGNLHDWLERTLADAAGSLSGRDPGDHGLVFLPFLGGERSTGWNPHARGTIHGLTFETTPLDLRQAAYEGVAFRFAAIADLLPQVREVVATGGGLLHDDDWIQIMADALARPIHVSGVPEASLRGAAVLALQRLGHEVAEAPIAGVIEPRADRAEAYRAARERQEELYEALT